MEQIYPDCKDTRSQTQILLTNQLIQKLTDLNTKINQGHKYVSTHLHKNVVTIAISGSPRSEEEWTQFKFPGKFVNYIPPGMEDGKSDQFYIQRLKKANMKDIVNELDQIVEQNNAKVVLASHSFGCYITTSYVHFHPQKVAGIMEFGGIPIRIPRLLKLLIKTPIFGIDRYPLSKILELKDELYQSYIKIFKGKNVNFMKNPYHVLSFAMILNQQVVRNVFKWKKEFPKNILKMITFGRKDKVFEPTLLNQLSVFYAYGNGSLDQNTNELLWKRYQLLTGARPSEFRNIQQRFIYSFPNTGHGPHLSKKQELQNIMNLYLSIVLIDIQEAPRL